ncbi:MAG: hypothetical protein INR66_26120, partial [Gordonia polyisoprenivorans]|nr:hypothetical protein [Gordonia polyisoprenivorans]
AARRLTTLPRDITRVLGLVRAGQLLAGAVCPWCTGTTPKHPEGGAITMRVEEIPGSRTLGVEPAAAVVCWNPLCAPPDADVGIWYRGRTAWPWHEWEWLATRLIISNAPRRASMLTETAFGDQAPIVLSGRSGVDQSVEIPAPRDPRLDVLRFEDEP